MGWAVPSEAVRHATAASRIGSLPSYGQGSSREHAAIAPRYPGLRLVVAKSFARIHWQSLVNFGMLPLTFVDPGDLEGLAQGDRLAVEGLRGQLEAGEKVVLRHVEGEREVETEHGLSGRQLEVLLVGGW